MKTLLPNRIYLDKDHNIIKPTEEMKYKSRLDKVLSKFIQKSRGKLYTNKYIVSIFYNDEFETFSLNDERNIISLDTVECLIRDMEANNE